MYSIHREQYKDEEAVVLQNDVLSVAVLPRWGAKIASIFYIPLNRELLWQNPGKQYRKTAYGDPYEAGEASGFDEMFPTISRCYYEADPWAGIEMPDHGEVWSIPWECETTEKEIRLSVKGVRFPYVLQKSVYLEESTLHQQYRIVNQSDADFEYIWAAHPLFNTSPGMKLVVPPGMCTIVNAVPSNRLGQYGRCYDFPMAKFGDGRVFDLSTVPEKNSGDYQKYWFLGKVTQGWCRLHDQHEKLSIDLRWPVEEVPYLGVWVNEGAWAGQYNIAPEPATGAMDRVDFSKMWGMGSQLGGGEKKQWWLSIAVREVEELHQSEQA
jgi:galactose mutarotase-like enzyme